MLATSIAAASAKPGSLVVVKVLLTEGATLLPRLIILITVLKLAVMLDIIVALLVKANASVFACCKPAIV